MKGMNQSDTDEFVQAINDMKTLPSLSGQFIRGSDIVWTISGSLFAFVLFFVWASQLFSFVPESTTTYYGLRALIGVYGLLTALSYNDSDVPSISQSKTDTDLVLTITRPAQLWISIVDALTASAICFAALAYILNNTLTGYAMITYVIAIISTFMFIPVIPMVSHDLDMPFLKSTIRLVINTESMSLTALEITVHPMERKWDKELASGEVHNSIIEGMIALLPKLTTTLKPIETHSASEDALPIA